MSGPPHRLDPAAAAATTILVVDDEDGTRYATSRVLRHAGFKVVEAANGQQALDVTEPVDAIVLDVRLPDIDGFEVCRRLRLRDGLGDLPVLHLSAAHVDDDDKIRGLRSGADAYLTHPVHPGVIVATLESLMRAREAQRRLRTIELEKHEEIERARDLFLGVLGHDLRNPLNAMLMSAQALMLREGMEADALKVAARIVKAGRRMKVMLDDLHDFAGTKLGAEMGLNRRSTQLATVVGDVVEEVRAAHPNARITLAVGGNPQGHWDTDRIARVVSNLVRNAIQYGADGTDVSVTVGTEAQQSVLTVSNQGPPIPPDVAARLFDPLVRGDGGRQDGNLGLGLFISCQIVRAHGGAITVESDTGATTFRVTLPSGRS